MDYRVISGDGHIDLEWLPHDLFVSNVPAKWRDRAPHVVETVEGKSWVAEGKGLTSFAFGGPVNFRPPERGVSVHIDRMHDAGFFDGKSHPTSPGLRLRDQELDGVDAEVIYGVLGMGTFVEDRWLLTTVYEIYNTWVAEFCKSNPSRFAALACLPNDDPRSAVDELRRAAQLGLRGADFAVSTASKPIWHRDWDPLWAAVEECNMPISFHTTGVAVRAPSDERMAMEYETPYRATEIVAFQIAGAEVLAGIVFSGALERHPAMKFVLGECGVGWIPYVLGRMDQEYENHFGALNFSLKPSEYWRRQGYTTFQNESTVAEAVHVVGEDNILWGSDYPHPDGIWPDSMEHIQRDLGHLDPRVRRKITCENAGKLYGFMAR